MLPGVPFMADVSPSLLCRGLSELNKVLRREGAFRGPLSGCHRLRREDCEKCT